jgi:hypothetical protein
MNRNSFLNNRIAVLFVVSIFGIGLAILQATIVMAVSPVAPISISESVQTFVSSDGKWFNQEKEGGATPVVNGGQVCTKTPPSLLMPISGTTVNTLIPDFVWEVISGTLDYEFDLSLSDTFSQTEKNTSWWHISQGGMTFTYEIPYNLIPDTIYYWRVAGYCLGIGAGPYSQVFSFRSGPATGRRPLAPTLTSPVDGLHASSIRVNFAWEEVRGATGYRISWSHTITDAVNDATISWFNFFPFPHFSAYRTFDPKETVYWHVKAKNQYAWGPLSAIRFFVTPPVTATAVISPDIGGTIDPDPGNVSIQFPPNAVTTTVTVSYTLQPQPNHNLANFRFGGRAFTLEAFSQDGQQIHDFNAPITITLSYDGWDLATYGINNPSRLNLAYWNGSEWQPILPCTGCYVDVEQHRIVIVVNHFTEFAVVASPTDWDLYLPLITR